MIKSMMMNGINIYGFIQNTLDGSVLIVKYHF